MVIPLFGISKVVFSDLWIILLSSESTCAYIASFVFAYPNAVATSFPTNHGSPSISMHLRSPNSGLLKSLHLEVEEEGVTNRYPIISKGIVKRDHLADKGRGSPKNKTIDAKHPPPKLFFSRLKKIGPFRT